MSTTTAPPPPRIDPRIRARRQEVRRHEGRRRLRRLLGVGAVVAVLAGLWALAMSPVLDVDEVRVVGAERSGAEAVAAATGIEPGDPLLRVDLGAAAAGASRLPWVATVEVRRSWPGTVEVEVTERTPVVALPTPDGWVLVDVEGRQLEVVAEVPPEVLTVDGEAVEADPGATVERHERAVVVAASVPEPLRERLLGLRSDDAEVQATVRLDDGTESVVRIGPPNQLEATWLALLAILAEVDPAGLAVIDLRVPTAPALTRNG